MTPAQIRAAKALLGWNNDDVAQRTGLSRNTVQAIQVGDELRGTVRTARLLREVFEREGVDFVVDRHSGAIGVMIRPKGGALA